MEIQAMESLIMTLKKRLKNTRSRLADLEAENKRLMKRLEGLGSQHTPCGPTCFHHITHPCEDCGRIFGYLPAVWEELSGKAERDRLKNQLVKYGNHERDCAVFTPHAEIVPCTCGFEQALSRQKGGGQ